MTPAAPDNTVTILLAIITLIGMIATSIISAVVAIMTNNNKTAILATHALVNGQTDALLHLTTISARALGVAAGAAGELPQDAAIAAVKLPEVPAPPTVG